MTAVQLATVTAGGADGSVAAVMAPVDPGGAADPGVGYAAAAWDAIVDVWHGYYGTPITGPTNWNAYSHPELYQMVHSGADPRQVGQQSDVVNQLAVSAQETTDEIDRQYQAMPSFWQGAASGDASGVLDQHRQGGAQAAAFITSLSGAMDRASAALSEAQRTMPTPVPVDDIVKAGGDLGASAASAGAWGVRGLGAAVDAGAGMFGFHPGLEKKVNSAAQAAGSFLGAGVSGFAAGVLSARAKAQAVAVMQRYERSLQDAGAGITMPAVLPPAGPDSPEGVGVLSSRQGMVHLAAADGSTAGMSAATGTGPGHGVGTVTGSGSEQPRGSAGVARPPISMPTAVSPTELVRPGSSLGTSVAAAAVPGGGVAAVMPGAGGGLGMDGRAGGGPTAWRDLVGRSTGAGLLPPALPGAGRGGASAGKPAVRSGAGAGRGGPGTPGGPGAGRRSEDEEAEHRNKMPHSDDLFSTNDMKLPPPVIGA